MRIPLRTCTLLTCLVLSLSACQPAGEPTREQGTAAIGTIPTATPSVGRTQSPKPLATPRPTWTPTRPRPTPAPFGGWLVFSSRREDTSGDGVVDQQDAAHLYVMDLATGDTTQLTFGNWNDTEPSWWPDRSRIAFVSNRGGNSDIFVINADGSGLMQLTATREIEGDPAVSPDGKTIAYTAETPLKEGLPTRRLYLLSVEGGEPRPLTEGPGNDSFPDWSPDGRFLAFERDEPGEWETAIYLWDAKTGTASALDLPATSAEPPVVLPEFPVVFQLPRWLPRAGDYLSLIRAGFEEGAPLPIVVFQIQEHAGQVTLRQAPAVIETNFIHYTWGPNGEWLIAPVKSPSGEFKGRALLRVRVGLAGASRACSGCTGVLDAQFLTAGDFYDDYPDWAP